MKTLNQLVVHFTGGRFSFHPFEKRTVEVFLKNNFYLRDSNINLMFTGNVIHCHFAAAFNTNVK